MPEVANISVGTSVVSTATLLNYQERIVELQQLSDSKSNQITLLDEQLRAAKAEQRVIVKEKNGWGTDKIVGHLNLDDVKLDLEKKAEEKVRKELIELRAAKLSFDTELELLKKTHNNSISVIERENEIDSERSINREKRRAEAAIEEKSKIEKESIEKIKEITLVKDKALAECNDLIQDLNQKITEKVDSEIKEKSLDNLNKIVSDLTMKLSDYYSKNIFTKIRLFFKPSYDSVVEQINDLRWSLQSDIRDLKNTTLNLPKSFNKYATCKVMNEITRYDYDLGERVTTVTFRQY